MQESKTDRKIMTHASLFSGIGAAELAATWMGWKNLFHCDINEYGNRVLNYWFPESKGYKNVKETDFTEWRGKVDVLTGGFPCQPFSNAGSRKGTKDDRYLWPEMLRVIREVRPSWVVGENVAGILSMVQPGKGTAVAQTRPLFGESDTIYQKRERYVVEAICSDLEKEGYSVQPFNIPACGVGAPHKRERIWFIASRNTADSGLLGQEKSEKPAMGIDKLHEGKSVTDTASMGWQERRSTCRRKYKDEDNRSDLFFKSERSCQEQSASDTTCNGYLSQGKSERAEKEKRFISQPDKRGNTAEWSDELSIFQQYNSSEEYREGQKKRMLEKSFIPAEIWSDFPTVSPVCRGNDGIPFDLSALAVSFPKWRQETITALGNSMVPEVVYEIFRTIETASN